MEEKESNPTTPSTDPYTKEFLEEMERRRTLAGEKPITHLPYEAVPKPRTKKPQGFFVRHRILTQSVQLNVIFFCTALGAAFISGWML